MAHRTRLCTVELAAFPACGYPFFKLVQVAMTFLPSCATTGTASAAEHSRVTRHGCALLSLAQAVTVPATETSAIQKCIFDITVSESHFIDMPAVPSHQMIISVISKDHWVGCQVAAGAA